jgi:methyl-accepting chemotaxis protein
MVPENSVLGAVRVSYSLASLDSSIHSSTLVSIGINATIFTLGMILLAFILKRILVNPITHLRDTMEGLRNDSDLKRRMPVTSEDELGQVASAFNHMLEMFQSIVGQISGTSGRLEEAAMQTSRVAESTSNGVERQQHEAGQVTSVMMELNSLVQDVATHTASSVEMARHADDQAEQGHNVMCETVTCLNNLAHEVDNAANTITELETASENIGAILDAIKGIADQTNLLALNAAIEAARAGEQGRGFAVVADEVRNLASRTEEATREIDKMIDSFRSDARRAVDVMSSGREQAQASISKADETNNRLNAIRIAVNEITQMNTQIATVAERQREVAEESAKNMESINAISRETAMGAGETTQASETITALSHELRVLVNKFAI